MTTPPSSSPDNGSPDTPDGRTPSGVPSGARRATKRSALSARARSGGGTRPPRSPKAMAVSVLVHIAVVVVVVQLLTFGHGISNFFQFGNTDTTEERLTYVATLPKRVPPQPVPTTKPVTPTAAPTNVPFSAPYTAPSSAPAGVPTPARADTGSGGAPAGTGNGVGAIDPNLRGVKPSFGDPRVWEAPVGNGMAPARNGAERLDSIMGYAITAARDSLDSLARAQGKYGKAPGDWTKTDKNGNKWGWDNQGIRLGKVVIPNALLSLLPLNAQVGLSGNYTAIERERRLSASREDIMRMSERGQGEAEFRKIANELRDRRELERRDRLRAPKASVAPTAPTPPKNNERD
jgi:hypothetical protein